MIPSHEAIEAVFPWVETLLDRGKPIYSLGERLWITREYPVPDHWGVDFTLGAVHSNNEWEVLLQVALNPHGDRYQQHLVGFLSAARGIYNRWTYRDVPSGENVEIGGRTFRKVTPPRAPTCLQLLDYPEYLYVLHQAKAGAHEPFQWVWRRDGEDLWTLGFTDTVEEAVLRIDAVLDGR